LQTGGRIFDERKYAFADLSGGEHDKVNTIPVFNGNRQGLAIYPSAFSADTRSPANESGFAQNNGDNLKIFSGGIAEYRLRDLVNRYLARMTGEPREYARTIFLSDVYAIGALLRGCLIASNQLILILSMAPIHSGRPFGVEATPRGF
jgi:hypothetical protein